MLHRLIGLHECNIIWSLNYSFFEPIEGDDKGEEVARGHREVSYHVDVSVVGKDGRRSKSRAVLIGKYEAELQNDGLM